MPATDHPAIEPTIGILADRHRPDVQFVLDAVTVVLAAGDAADGHFQLGHRVDILVPRLADIVIATGDLVDAAFGYLQQHVLVGVPRNKTVPVVERERVEIQGALGQPQRAVIVRFGEFDDVTQQRTAHTVPEIVGMHCHDSQRHVVFARES